MILNRGNKGLLSLQWNGIIIFASYLVAWAGKWDLPINPNKSACLTVGNLLPLSPSFSTADTDHRIPQVTDVRDLGVPLDTTFTASAHCIEAANTARRLLFLVRRSFCELSKTVFTQLYCALVRPHLEYAMEANVPTLRADINQLERVQHLATRLVKRLRHVPYEERHRQLTTGVSDRTSSYRILHGPSCLR